MKCLEQRFVIENISVNWGEAVKSLLSNLKSPKNKCWLGMWHKCDTRLRSVWKCQIETQTTAFYQLLVQHSLSLCWPSCVSCMKNIYIYEIKKTFNAFFLKSSELCCLTVFFCFCLFHCIKTCCCGWRTDETPPRSYSRSPVPVVPTLTASLLSASSLCHGRLVRSLGNLHVVTGSRDPMCCGPVPQPTQAPSSA